MPSGTTTLFMDKIEALLPFDAMEPTNSDSNRKSYGNNDWAVSNLRQWANSSASAGNWYSAQHSADAPPSAANVWKNSGVAINPYQSLPGFLYEATTEERAALVATTRQYAGWSSNQKSSVDKLFPLTSNEVGLETIAGNGTKIPYFTDANSRITQCSANCIAQSNYQSNPSTTSAWYYWLQNSYPSYSHSVRDVNTGGSLNNDSAYHGRVGVRLACNLQSDILVSDSTDGDGCYTIIYNQPPSAPATLDVPSTIRSTKSFEISWSAASDPEGYLSGYVLQRKLDGGEWGEIYRGSARSYNDTVASGTSTVQYRVQSYDNQGSTSTWTTSGVRSVLNNQPPAISQSGVDNPTPSSKPPKLTYTVTDPDGGTVTVDEYFDEKKIKTHTPELGQEQTCVIDDATWLEAANGEHSYRIVATDDKQDSVSSSASFTKKVESVDFTLKTPMETDDRPTAATLNVQGSFPAGCELKVEICNNGLDEEPAWVDATDEAKNGMKIFFQNQDKTAEKWAIGIRFHLARGSASPEDPVFVVSLGGNFA